MKRIKNLGIGLLLILAVDSCIKEPTYSIIPHIEFQDLIFRKGSIQDTLIFRLKFTDGDGDLGIGAEDLTGPNFYNYYNPWYWAYNTTDFTQQAFAVDNTLTPPTGYQWITYKSRKLPQFDTLPGINCENWQQLKDNSAQPKVIDTIYMTQNLKAFNINVDVYIKNSSGAYVKFNPGDYFSFPGCSPNLFRGAFPDLSNDRKSSPLDGTITYKLQSSGLYYLFSTKTLKMDVTINDRAFHISNVIEKKDFTLQQITR